jgi:hypothetical protein
MEGLGLKAGEFGISKNRDSKLFADNPLISKDPLQRNVWKKLGKNLDPLFFSDHNSLI